MGHTVNIKMGDNISGMGDIQLTTSFTVLEPRTSLPHQQPTFPTLHQGYFLGFLLEGSTSIL